MGYDYRWVEAATKEEKAESEALSGQLASARDQLKLKAQEYGSKTYGNWYLGIETPPEDVVPLLAKVEQLESEHQLTVGTFRWNIFTGPKIADVMVELGIAFDIPQEQVPGFPHLADFGVFDDEDENLWASEEDLVHPLGPGVKEYRAAREAHLKWHGPETPGIPTHKFAGSNDGWIVLPVEIKPALALYVMRDRSEVIAAVQQHCAREGDDLNGWLARWDQWITFITRAADHGGFETH
jgi:hypothetical protein